MLRFNGCSCSDLVSCHGVAKLRNWGQKSLQTSFGIPLSPQTRYKMKAVVIGDSSISSVSVKYGLSMVLRHAGIYLYWLLAKSGACARELADIWQGAPPCDLGLTITNCNDIFQDFSMPPHLSEDIKHLVESAHRKTQVHAVFFVNDAGFYPKLRPDVYPGLVQQTKNLFRHHGGEVHDGSEFLDLSGQWSQIRR